MQTTQWTVAGSGVLHDCRTRDGQQFRILVAPSGSREIFIYDSTESDRAVVTLVLEEDEAQLVSELLQGPSMADKIAELERRVAQLADSRR